MKDVNWHSPCTLWQARCMPLARLLHCFLRGPQKGGGGPKRPQPPIRSPKGSVGLKKKLGKFWTPYLLGHFSLSLRGQQSITTELLKVPSTGLKWCFEDDFDGATKQADFTPLQNWAKNTENPEKPINLIDAEFFPQEFANCSRSRSRNTELHSFLMQPFENWRWWTKPLDFCQFFFFFSNWKYVVGGPCRLSAGLAVLKSDFRGDKMTKFLWIF